MLLPLRMLTAIDLDDQVPFETTEICEVRTNAVLPAKFEAAEALGSEVLSQLPLLLRRLGAKTPAFFLAKSRQNS
jgi:hypothetical protein